MTKTAASVDEYIAAQPEDVRAVLERVRDTIRGAVPDAEETISYNIPAYKLHGATVLSFAGWKKHYSLYPVKQNVLAACIDEPVRYEADKGTIRFRLSEPVPAALIERIAKFRAREIAGANGLRRAAGDPFSKRELGRAAALGGQAARERN